MNTRMDQPGEPQGGGHGADPLVAALRQVWWAGLGLVSVAGKQAGRALNALVEEGKGIEPTVVSQGKKAASEVSEMMEDLGERVRKVPEKLRFSGGEEGESPMDERIAAALRRMGLPSKKDLRNLSDKIDGLAARLETMQKPTTGPQV